MKKISLKLFPLLISILFVFPILKESLSSFIVIVICINVIIYKVSAKDFSFFESKTLLLTIPFWIIFFRSLFSDNSAISAVHIQHSLFFLIIPVFFSLIPSKFFDTQKLNLYMMVLKLTCLLIAIIYIISFFCDYSIAEFFIVFQHVSSFRSYIYYEFKLFVIHPTYYTSLLVICSAHSFDLILKQKKYSESIFIISFLLISFLLLTRLNIVLLISTLILMIFLRSGLKVKQMIFISSAMLILVFVLAVLTPGIKYRFVELFQSFNVKPENVSYDSTNIRKAIFDSSVAIAKENWEFGVGFENLQNKLNDTYKENYDSSFYTNQSYMTHNYYFYIFLSSGIIGLLIYLFYLLNIVKICLKSNVFLFKVFLFNILILCCIEDFFYRHYGILYFNLFLLCFIRYSENLTEENKLKSNLN